MDAWKVVERVDELGRLWLLEEDGERTGEAILREAERLWQQVESGEAALALSEWAPPEVAPLLSGDVSILERLRSSHGAGMAEVLRVRGIGASRARRIREALGVRDLAGLEASLGRLEDVAGIGRATAASLRREAAAARAELEARRAQAAEWRRRRAGATPPVGAGRSLGELLRDPESSAVGFRVGTEVAASRDGAVSWPVLDGYIDVIGGEPEPPSLSQRLMESGFYPRLYEELFRPALTRTATRQSLAEAMALSCRMASPAANAVVLDLACGTGNFTRALAALVDPQEGCVVGVDLSRSMLTGAVQRQAETGVRNIHWVRGDAHALPFRAGVVDVAHCAGALHLMPDPGRVLGELRRVLRPGGRLVVGTFAVSTWPVLAKVQEAAGPLVGFRFFEPGELLGLVEEAGFEVEEEVREDAAWTFLAHAA